MLGTGSSSATRADTSSHLPLPLRSSQFSCLLCPQVILVGSFLMEPWPVPATAFTFKSSLFLAWTTVAIPSLASFNLSLRVTGMIFSKCKSDFIFFPKTAMSHKIKLNMPGMVPRALHHWSPYRLTDIPVPMPTTPSSAHTACFRPLHVLLTGCCDLKCSPSLVPLERSYPFHRTALLCPIVPSGLSPLTSPASHLLYI